MTVHDYRRSAYLIAALAVTAAAVAVPSKSAEIAGFRTPSNNIHCQFIDADNEFPANLRCDIMKVDTPVPPPPRDCDGEWGRSFSITHADEAGQMICVGDAVYDERHPVLNYGLIWQRGGFTCTSEESGISCFNARRHGFSLSRAVRRVF